MRKPLSKVLYGNFTRPKTSEIAERTMHPFCKSFNENIVTKYDLWLRSVHSPNCVLFVPCALCIVCIVFYVDSIQMTITKLGVCLYATLCSYVCLCICITYNAVATAYRMVNFWCCAIINFLRTEIQYLARLYTRAKCFAKWKQKGKTEKCSHQNWKYGIATAATSAWHIQMLIVPYLCHFT